VGLFGEHEVVGNSDRDSFWKNGGVYKKRVHGTPTADVEIHVNAAIMIEDEVADSVSTLDGITVVVEGVYEPWIVCSNKFARAGIGPEHVLAGEWVRVCKDKKGANRLVGHHGPACLGYAAPAGRKNVCFPCLVDDAWNAFLCEI